MAFTDLSARLQEIADNLDSQAVDVAVVQSMGELQANYIQRVFVQGLDSNNSELGNYSEKPNYFSKEQFVRKSAFKPQGQKGFKGERIKEVSPGQFKVVKSEVKTMYLKQGYKELRQIQARPTDKVNLDYSGSLKNAYRVFKFGSSVVFGQNDTFEHKKIEGLTDKFGEFQTLTPQEVEQLKNSLEEGVKIVVNNG